MHRISPPLWFSLAALTGSLGCGESPPAVDAGALDANADANVDVGPDYLPRLDSAGEFLSLAGEGLEVKYLLQVDGREPLVDHPCMFQNTARFAYHIQFLRAAFPAYADLDPGTYADLVLRRRSRRSFAGSLTRHDRTTHPRSGLRGIYTYNVYQDLGPGEGLSLAEIVEVDQRMKSCAPFDADQLVYLPEGAEREAAVRRMLPELRAAGVDVRFLDELIEQDYEAYSVGESYGYLHVIPESSTGDLAENYGPQDVLVLQSPPNDLTTVAGLVTTLPQSVHSHVNLRLREKMIPNVLLASAFEDERINALGSRLVHIVAAEDSLTIEEATLEDAEAFWASRRPELPPLRSDLETSEFRSFLELGHVDADAFGAKAANLGELHSVLEAENRVEGFGIPFRAYQEFIVHNGLDDAIDALLSDPEVATDRSARANALTTLRRTIRRGDFQPEFFGRLTTRLREVFGPEADTTYIRFRSSTNAEDLAAFSGAGIYDSRTGCLADDLDGDTLGPSHCLSAAHGAFIDAELERLGLEQADHPERTWLAALITDLEEDRSEEKPVADALRKVWRSLWNLRAYDEREFYGIDHSEAYMGIAVQPSFVLEQQEAVAVTNLGPADALPLYRVVSQVGDVGVVRPSDPSAVPETLTFRREGSSATDVQVLIPSSLAPGGAPLWSESQLSTLAGLLFLVQDHFAAEVYAELAPLRLDIEIELTRDDRIVIKQARPYLGGAE
ncbi:MAG: pyruvate,water dikinase [Polyangiales bacterium]|jgi:pyruvate,water dikinase